MWWKAICFAVLIAATTKSVNSQNGVNAYLGSAAVVNGTFAYLPFVDADGSPLCALDSPWKRWHGHLDQCSQACSRLDGCFYFNHRDGDACEMFDCMPLAFDAVTNCRGYQREDTVLSCTPDASGAIPARCCSFPFTWKGQNYLQCTPASDNDPTPGCRKKDGEWANCKQPSNFLATWEFSAYGKDIQLPLFSINNWIVIANKVPDGDSSTAFTQSWQLYKEGFGVLSLLENYWIGNDYLHQLTHNRGQVRLRVEIQRRDKQWYYAEYQSFVVGDEASGFKLTIDTASYHGDAGQALTSANGMKFSTVDRDNDKCGCSCAERYHSGWWYNDCGTAAPTQRHDGLWNADGTSTADVIASRLYIKQSKSSVN